MAYYYPTELYRIYWPGYPSKWLYVKCTGHETHNTIATSTKATLGLKSNQAVKRIDYYSCFTHWQMLQHIIPHLHGHTLFHVWPY